jgi:hypothetical protein
MTRRDTLNKLLKKYVKPTPKVQVEEAPAKRTPLSIIDVNREQDVVVEMDFFGEYSEAI